MAIAALVVIGIILVILGIFAGGNLYVLTLGVVALVAAGGYEVLAMRRGK
jgi:hypothetical protein